MRLLLSSVYMKQIVIFFFLACCLKAQAQRTMGLMDYQNPNADGYVLFAPIPSLNTYLIDKCGEKVHQWTSTYQPGLSAYLLPDGSLIRTGTADNPVFSSGGNGGVIEKFDWNGNLTWSYVISDNFECQHHDIMPLPNGNILAIVWEMHDSVEAVANGKNPNQVNAQFWGEKILELQPVGTNSVNIVWQWRAWDHLVQEFDASKLNYASVDQHPELANINYTTGIPANEDWLHLNSIDYNPGLDQILISSHNLSEIWVIDHSTTAAEAATHSGGQWGKGGDILYRWGNPKAYNRGTTSDRVFYSQHHASWVPAGLPDEGKILVFNNGLNRPAGNYTSLDMIVPPFDSLTGYQIGPTTAFLPDTLFWTYTAPTPTDFYANKIGGVYELKDRSFMITNGPKGIFIEIDSSENIVWKYINPVSTNILSQGNNPTGNSVFRCNFYPMNYPAFASVTLIPQGEIELNPIVPSICDSILSNVTMINSEITISIYPNPATSKLLLISSIPIYSFELFNSVGSSVLRKNISRQSCEMDISELTPGIYIAKIYSESSTFTSKLAIVK
jgi:hypothetical protein